MRRGRPGRAVREGQEGALRGRAEGRGQPREDRADPRQDRRGGEDRRVRSADLDLYIRREAARTKQRPDKLAKDLAKDRNALRSVQQSIIFDKSVDFLVSKATCHACPNRELLRTHRPREHRPRRAVDGHLFAAAQGPDHLHRDADRRHGREPRHRPAPLPADGGREEGHPPLHQLPGRRRDRRDGDLRHHEFPAVRRADLLHRHGGQHEHGPARRRDQGQALRAARTAA